MNLLRIAVIVAVALSCQARRNFDGYQVLYIDIETQHQVKLLQGLVKDDGLDFWSKPRSIGTPVEVMASPKSRSGLVAFLRKHDFKFSILVEDVEKKIEHEMSRLNARRDSAGKMSYDFNDWNDYDAMMQQLEYFAGNCTAPLSCSLESIGDSYEGRPLTLLSVTTAPDDTSRKGYWLDSLIHAREWLAGTSVMNIINHMLTTYSTDADVTYLLDTYNFYFLPIMNPDGYIYSWDVDRYWRKSRNVNEGSECMGTDLNRNYAYSWGTDGTSTLPCSDTYGGSSAASEPETQAVQAAADQRAPQLDGWISNHCAANMWLHPFGNSVEGSNDCAISPDHDHQFQVAEAAAIATMAEYGTAWTYGSICQTIYAASGSTCDYAYSAGTKYSYTPELRGPGFDPPPENIEPGWRELWAGVKALISEVESIEYA